MIEKFLLPLLIVLTQGIHSGNNKITGKVYDNNTKEELVGVRVISDCDTVYTDLNGVFQIKYLNDSTNLLFSLTSYSPDTVNINSFIEKF